MELGDNNSADDEKVRIRVVRFCIAAGGIARGVGQHASFQERYYVCMKWRSSHTYMRQLAQLWNELLHYASLLGEERSVMGKVWPFLTVASDG